MANVEPVNLGVVIARAPNHLGDGVMALPALSALASAADRLVIIAPGWGPSLYVMLDAEVVSRDTRPTGDIAVLFAPSFRVAWEARHIPRRIGWPGDWRRWLLTDTVHTTGHRVDRYAALLRPLGLDVLGPPTLSFPDIVPRLSSGTVAFNPISVSGATVQWSGYRELADRLDRPVVFFAGPGEEKALADCAGTHHQRAGLSLEQFSAELSQCALFVSNDSGAAHFARALGVPTLVIYGSTSPQLTGPIGSVAVEVGPMSCRPCYKDVCRVGGEPCLDISVDTVHESVMRILGTPA